MGNNEQIADATVVVSMGGSWGGYGGRAWFDLMGYNETIAGLTDGTSEAYVRNMATQRLGADLGGSRNLFADQHDDSKTAPPAPSAS